MNVQTVNEIAECIFVRHRVIEAIRLLRLNTSMSLLNAKRYVDEHLLLGESGFIQKLCNDFVENKQDLLTHARQKRHLLDLYIDQLEFEIANDSSKEPSV